MAGITRDEGTTLVSEVYPEFFVNRTISKEAFKEFVREANNDFHNIDIENITEYYLRNINSNDTEVIQSRLFDFFGDFLIKCPTYLFAKRYAEHSSDKTRVFFYELTYAMGSEVIFHAADLLYLFGYPLSGDQFPKEDKEFSKTIINYWTNFAKHGYYYAKP